MANQEWRNCPVLVTGGMGFIGSNLVRRLVSLGASVTVIDLNLTDYGAHSHNLADIASSVEIVTADIGDNAATAAAIGKAAIVFNLAGQTSHADSMTRPAADLALNQAANLRFLEQIRALNPALRIVYTSTRQLYGVPRYLPVDEAHPVVPPDINGIHKFAAESYHLLYARVYGLRATALRLTNVYGPRMRIRDAKQTFLGIWVRHVVEDGCFELWGGDQLRDFTYVDDLVDALLATAASPATVGQVFNVGGCSPITLLALAEQLVAIAGSGRFERRAFPEERKKIDIGDFYSADGPFRAATGWQPKTPLSSGLAETLAFYRSNLAHYLSES